MMIKRIALATCAGLLLGCGGGGGGGGGSAPAQTTTAPVTTSSPGATPNPYTPTNPMTNQSGSVFLSGFMPQSGHPQGGELLVISGMGFDATSQVTINGFNARVIERTDTQLVVETPSSSGNATIRVENGPSDFAVALEPYVYMTPTTADDFHFRADTDKWWVNTDYAPGADADNNGFSDLSDALQAARNELGGTGFSAQYEQGVAYLFSYLNQMYRNNPDGSPRFGGAPVSFQRTPPGFGRMPSIPGRPESVVDRVDHNMIAVRNVGHISPGYEESGTTGRASAEDARNVTIENNSGISDASGNPLGAYADALVYWWNRSSVPQSRRTLDNFMEELAALVAHEVGHSLGLDHLDDAPLAPATDNIMAATTTIGTGSNVYAFDEPTWNAMIGWLPGTLRQVHRAAWTPRRLLAEADAVVMATPIRLSGGALELEVDSVLAGAMTSGFNRIGGFDVETAVGKAQMAATGQTLMFLTEGPTGMIVDLGKASALSLEGRDPAEWQALLDDFRGLAEMQGPAWEARLAEILTGCLDSTDARIRADALVDLSTEPAVVQGLSAAQTEQVAAVLREGASAFERCLAAQVLAHKADAAQVETLLAAGLAEDHPAVLADVAAALEQTMGLETAAEQVRARLVDLDLAGRQRASTLLGWLQDRQSIALIAADLGAAADRARRAADALGAMADPAALAALQTLVDDASADANARLRALRAIGRIGGADATAWLTAAAERLESEALRDGARFARDFPATWLIR